MTKREAIMWVADNRHRSSAAELEEAFAALYGRRATDDDKYNGLWPLCCAALDAFLLDLPDLIDSGSVRAADLFCKEDEAAT